MGVHSTVMEAITCYTGLSPTAFFTILVMMVMVYQTVCGMFVSPEDYNKPPTITAPNNIGLDGVNVDAPEPVQMGEMTDQELRTYNGSDPNKPILVSIRSQIYDVSAGRPSPLSSVCGQDMNKLSRPGPHPRTGKHILRLSTANGSELDILVPRPVSTGGVSLLQPRSSANGRFFFKPPTVDGDSFFGYIYHSR